MGCKIQFCNRPIQPVRISTDRLRLRIVKQNKTNWGLIQLRVELLEQKFPIFLFRNCFQTKKLVCWAWMGVVPVQILIVAILSRKAFYLTNMKEELCR